MSDWEPKWASPPGDTLTEALQERDWTPKYLSRETGIPLQHIDGVISGDDSVDVRLAVALEKLGVGSARFWLHREADYQLSMYRLANSGR